MFCVNMNFNQAEKLREDLRKNSNELKKFKARSNQGKFLTLTRDQGKLLDELFNEIKELKVSFEMFKLHTLSTIEEEKKNETHTKCVTNPFSIYVQQK